MRSEDRVQERVVNHGFSSIGRVALGQLGARRTKKVDQRLTQEAWLEPAEEAAGEEERSRRGEQDGPEIDASSRGRRPVEFIE